MKIDAYTTMQRPEEQKTFTVTDIQMITGASPDTIRSIAEQCNIESKVNKQRHTLVYDYTSMKQIVAVYQKLAGVTEIKKLNTVKETKSIEQLRAEHPLVTDDNFFKLSYFPDVVPKCFSECE